MSWTIKTVPAKDEDTIMDLKPAIDWEAAIETKSAKAKELTRS